MSVVQTNSSQFPSNQFSSNSRSLSDRPSGQAVTGQAANSLVLAEVCADSAPLCQGNNHQALVVSNQPVATALATEQGVLQGELQRDQQQSAAQLCWLTAASAERDSLQAFIADGFAQVYGAQVRHFMPHLLAVRAADDKQWHAVLGIRTAASGPLFVEQYLDADISQVLGEHQVQCHRSHIAEIGNLYAASRQHTLLLFIAMAEALFQQGLRHLVCCATPAVMSMLSRHGLQLKVLADGDPSRLGAEANDWGTYYQKHPQVCHLSLVEAVAIIRQQPRLIAMLQPWQALLTQAANALQQPREH